MRGVISAIARDGSYGQIAADDGERYSYWSSQIRNGPVAIGDPVNFQMHEGQPVDIFNLAAALAADPPGPPPAPSGGPRPAVAAGQGRPRPAAGAQPRPAFAGQAQAWAAHFDAQAAQAGLPAGNYWVALFTSPQGRISRRQFWLHGVLPLIGIGILLKVAAYTVLFIAPTMVLLASFVIFLVLLWPQLCISYKRFQDVGYPGWYNLAWLLPMLGAQVLSVLGLYLDSLSSISLLETLELVLSSIAGLVALAALIFVYIRPGQEGANEYGPDPLAAA
jgi:uncharacterized membrane protein YhaH (DUF805 family)